MKFECLAQKCEKTCCSGNYFKGIPVNVLDMVNIASYFKDKGLEINIKNIVFIDAISKSIKQNPVESDNTYFVSSPGALTELSLVITKFLKHNFDYIIFDSINHLSTYRDKKTVETFVSSIVNKIKGSKTKTVFYAIETKENEDWVKKCSMFVDNTVSYT